jgi:hypothetical protein
MRATAINFAHDSFRTFVLGATALFNMLLSQRMQQAIGRRQQGVASKSVTSTRPFLPARPIGETGGIAGCCQLGQSKVVWMQ